MFSSILNIDFTKKTNLTQIKSEEKNCNRILQTDLKQY